MDWDDLDFTEVGSCYKSDFYNWESALSGTRPSCFLRANCVCTYQEESCAAHGVFTGAVKLPMCCPLQTQTRIQQIRAQCNTS